MVIVGLTVLLAALFQVPLEGNWFLAILVPLEVVFAVICWLALAYKLSQMTSEARRDVGWGTRIFVPEAILICMLMLVKDEVPELAEAVWEKWNGWLESIPRTTYLRAFCATAAALIGFCLSIVVLVLLEAGFDRIPNALLLFAVTMMLLSFYTTTRGGELGAWFSRWLLAVSFYMLWKGRVDLAWAEAWTAFSVTFFALYLGRFVADVAEKKQRIGTSLSR